MQEAGLNIILPVFAILVAGFIAGRARILPETSSQVLSQFVFYVSLPALIFVSLSRVSPAEFFNWSYIAVIGGGMLAMFIIGCVIARSAFSNEVTPMAMHGLAAMYSSTAYIGLPLVLTIFGEAALVPGIIGAIITGAVFAPLAIVIAEFDSRASEKRHFSRSLLMIFTRPPVLATVAGLLVSAIGFSVPPAAVTFFEMLGGAFVPCALFAAGLFISACNLRGLGAEVGWLLLAKLILHPLITWWLAYEVFELEGILPAVAVVQAALPTGVPVFILAQQYRSFVVRSSSVIAISTALSVVTLTLLLLLLEG
ncbi:MAG: AEC family transporter [Pseudomonadota bacterium]